MKPKVSPTSPKVNKKHQEELNKLYKTNLKTIEKPNSNRTGSVWFLFLVIIIGFLAGFLAPILLFTYGEQVPFLSKLGFSADNNSTSFFFSGGAKSKIVNTEMIQKTVEKIGPSVVQIYDAKDESTTIEALYVPGESRGAGFILTDDGYIVTSQSIVEASGSYVVVTDTSDIYPVESLTYDSATQLAFLKIDARGLSTYSIASLDDITPMQDVLLVRHYYPNSNPLIEKVSIVNSQYCVQEERQHIIQSSESYNRRLLLGSEIINPMQSSIAFTLTQEVLGIVIYENDVYQVVPFALLKPIIKDVLSGEQPKRPYLGIHYIDLGRSLNVPEELSGAALKGAFIYSDNEEERPSIIEASPAERAGLKKLDIITKVNGVKVNGYLNFSEIILELDSGELITLTVIRNGEERDIKVTLESIK